MLTCANCGEQNPERARSRLNCGASLVAGQRRGARQMQVRIGAATGEVMVEEAGGDPLVIGEAVNLATGLQAGAGPGEVVLDRRSWQLERADRFLAELGPVDAPGRRVAVEAAARLAAAGHTATGRGDLPAAAGRSGDQGLAAPPSLGKLELRLDSPDRARALAAQGRDDEAFAQATLSGELPVKDDLHAQVERRSPLAAVLASRGRLEEAERLAAETVRLGADSDMLGMQATAQARELLDA
jgi:hypothetical protein